jgi:hypothetical protein
MGYHAGQPKDGRLYPKPPVISCVFRQLSQSKQSGVEIDQLRSIVSLLRAGLRAGSRSIPVLGGWLGHMENAFVGIQLRSERNESD